MKRTGADHPKVKHLAQILNIEIWGAVGILELLWHFTARYAPQGDIGKYSDATIARAIGWEKHTGRKGVTPEYRLSSALVEAGWVDSCQCHRLVVHDWAEHADQQVKRKLLSEKLVFAHPYINEKIASQSQSQQPVPEPAAASSTSGVLNSGEPPGGPAAAAAAPPPAHGFKTAAEVAAAAGLADLSVPPQARVEAICAQVLHELESEGVPVPPRYITNEYGRQDRNPASERLEALLLAKENKILSARKPMALARKIILDELHGT